ncbi:MAG: right-handed parallel beta-helix repeat-containing protein [Bacteroidales bacterium]|nr:right-handed parallel beta-helix repeat-containing protein [Bacteroidales bacterium]
MGFKTLLFAIAIFFGILSSQAQTVVFSEDFETLPLEMTSSGSTNWARSTALSAGGSYSDTALVGFSGTSYLTTTNSFNTTGNYQVILEFDHICKIEFFDAGKIQYSIDGGTNWFDLTTTEYTGSGSFVSNKFTSQSYSGDWQAGTASAVPTNTWWKHESFNISALVGNQANVMLRFALSDGNNNGPNQNYGWLIDDVEVTMSVDETIPPVISLIAPYPVDTVYNLGPFTVKADITDASGIDTSILVYTVNSGTPDTLTMINTTGNTYQAIIPAQILYDTVRYYIYVTDQAMTNNSAREPVAGNIQFILKDSPPPPGCVTPVTVFPLIEDMESFTTGVPGTMANGWSGSPTSGFSWQVDKGGTPTYTTTGPLVDHTLGNSNGIYLFTEATSGSSGDTAYVYSPCIDINALSNPTLSFYYHMYGSTMGELHVDIWYGNDWVLDIVPAFIGQQQTTQTDPYLNIIADLSPYRSITQIRFRAVKGSSTAGDMAIDDIKIYNLEQYDAGVIEMTEPVTPAPTGTQDVKVKIMNFGYDVLTSATINWSVDGVPQTPFNWTGSIFSLDTSAEITVGTYNYTTGFYSMKFWTSVPNGFADQNTVNDTIEAALVVCGGGLAGTYSIDAATGDFPSFSDAALMLGTCGITAPVVFNVAADTYDETIVLGNVTGASATNTITFRSASGNAADVIIQPTTLPSDYAAVKFENISNVYWEDMTIELSGQTNARGFYITTGADTITIERNIINLPDVSTNTTNVTGIYDNTGQNSGITIKKNTINEGSYGIYIYGSGTTTLQSGTVIDSNLVQDFSSYGIRVYYMDAPELTYNTVISDDINVNTSVYGMYAGYSDNSAIIAANNIQMICPELSYGLYLYYNDGTTTNRGLVANNFISVLGENTTTISYGIYQSTNNYTDIVYNSMLMQDSYTSSRSFYVTGGTNNTLQNNSMANTGAGYAAYFSSTTSIGTSDYNNYFTNGTNLAYFSANRIDLATLQTASGKDAHSISDNPAYLSGTDLHSASLTMDGAANPIAGITTDIDGDLRDGTNPDIGADEYELMNNDIAIVGLEAPITACNGSLENIDIRFSNVGLLAVNSAKINWSINGTPQTPFYFGGTLGISQDTVVTIGTYTFMDGTVYTLEFIADSVNGVNDQNALNDTLVITPFQTALSGTKTIGATGDYLTFNDAVNDLMLKGVCGPIVFNIQTDTYNEQISLPAIAGVSAVNTITFQSETGNPADVIISVSSTGTGDNYVFQFNGVDYTTLQNLTLTNTGSSYSRVIDLKSGADYNTIDSCILNGNYPATPSTSTNYTVVNNTTGLDNGNTLSNNFINGGTYAIYWYGSGTTSLEEGTVIENNIISDFQSYGIYPYYQDDIIIRGNTVTQLNSTNTASTIYGISPRYCDSAMVVEANIININGSSTVYGLYPYYCDATSGQYGLISNNMVSVNSDNASASIYAYYPYYCNYQKHYNNSVNVLSSSTNARGIYLLGGANSDFVNNIVVNAGGGYAVYISTTAAYGNSDFNDYYSTGSNIGYFSSAITDIATWKSATSKDFNSISAEPFYTSAYDLHTFSTAVNNLGTPLAEVSTDIDGDLRDAVNPDMGADEYDVIAFNAALTQILSPLGGCGLSSAEPVTLQIVNLGAATINGSFNASYQVNGGSVITEAIATAILPGDTLDYTFTATLDMSVTTTDSTFNLIGWVDLLSDPINSNDTAYTTVISGHTPLDPVVTNDTIPYGTSATLLAIASDSVYWFVDNTTLVPFYQGNTYNTPLLTDTTTYFVESSTGITYNYTFDTDLQGWTPSTPCSYTTYIWDWDSDGGNGTAFMINPATNSSSVLSSPVLPVFGDTINFSFRHKYDTELNWDNGYVAYRIDGGAWAHFTPTTNTYNATDNLSTDPILASCVSGPSVGVFSGSGSTYRTSSGPVALNGGSTIEFAFVFSTDASGVSTGWFIDEVTIEKSGCSSNRIPVTAVVLPPPADFELTEILTPIEGCTDGTEYVQIKITNAGADTINNPFDVSYQVNATAPVTENVSYVILPGDSTTHTFITPIALPLLSGDTTFTLTCYGNVAVDTYTVNDTMSGSYTMSFTPPMPVAIHDTVPYGSSATVGATSAYPVTWYDQPVGGNILDTGLTYTTPILYGNQTYYIETSDGSGGDTLTTTFAGGNGCSGGSMFDITTLAGGITIDAFEINIDAVVPTPVDVYYKSGTYLGSETTAGAWTLLGTFSAIGAGTDNPSYLDVTDFTIPAGQTYGIYINVDINYTTSTATAANSDIEISVGAGLCGLFTSVNAGRQFNGSVIYGAGTGCASARDTVYAVVTGAPAVDAGITDITAPIGPIPLGIENVEAVLTNFGTNTLTSCDIAWTVNGMAQTNYNWAGSLLTGESDTIVIGTYDFVYTPYPGLNDVVVWSQNPNATIDPTNNNDTSSTAIDAHDPFNGTYYILTATPDFNTFNEAAVALNDWGIDGPVTILAATGIYDEQITLDTIPGISAMNTLTFGSETGINTDVTLQYAATGTTDNFVVQFNGTDYVTFENMTLKSTTASTYGRVVSMNNGCNFNTFDNNIIESVPSTSSNATAVYCYSGGVDNGNVFSNNQILNGYYGVYFYGSTTNMKGGNKFLNNTIDGYYYYGIYAYYNDSLTIKGNIMSNGTASGINYHIYSYYSHNGTEITENNIMASGTGTTYGIYAYNNNTSTIIPNLIANNFISTTGSNTGTAYGIYLSGSSYLNVYFNSISIATGSTTAGRALYQTGGTGNVNIANNSFANTAGGYAYYINSPGAISVTDYNNLYATGSALAYWNGDRADLAALQGASLKDAASISIDPIYYSSTDLHTGQYFLNGQGTDIVGITTDFDGDARNTPPTIGADEYVLLAADAGIIQFDEPIMTPAPGVHDVSVTLGNYSTGDLTNVDIAWSINGTPQTSVPWTGVLPTGTTVDSVLLGSPNFTWGIFNLKAWTEMPNGVSDLNNYNDTAEYQVVVCDGPMAGTYTIGSTGDFSTINDAVMYMEYCNIDSVVVFEIETGTYPESVSIPYVTGMNSTNTVTFRSQTGNAADVVIKPASTGSNTGIVEFDGAKYVSWENTTLDGDSLALVRGFYLEAAHNITLDGNTILLPDVSTSLTTICGIYDATGVDSNLVIINNTIYDGSYGMYLYGNSSTYQPGLVVSNNNVMDFASYGIYTYYLNNPVFTDNYIYTDTNTYSTIYGLRLYYIQDGFTVTGNNIVMADDESGYGLYMYYSDGLAVSRGLVANNFISFEGQGPSNTSYAAYMSGCDDVDFVFNSIHMYDTYTSSRAFYITGGTNITFQNNNVACTQGAIAVYFSSTTAVTTSDYNNLYSSGSVLGYYGGNQADLAAWQSASSGDANSYSVNPLFVSNEDLHIFLGTLDGKATPFAGITTDIDGDVRNATTPDIGADEFDGLLNDLALTGFVKPSNDFGFTTDQDTVEIIITNYGANNASGFTYSYSIDGITQTTENYSGTLVSGGIDTVEFVTLFTPNTGPNAICAWVALGSDGDNSNDTSCTLYKGIPTLLAEYLDNFESNDYFGANSVTGGWEFGAPAGTVINTAYSPTTAWVTNLDGAYDFNMNNALYSPKFNFIGIYNAELRFYHQYDIEAGDIAYIEYSNNNGISWNSLGILNDPNGTNWYASTVGSYIGWNGTSSGWEYSTIDLSAFNNTPFPVQFRFVFYSDFSGINGEGWAIDNFEIFVPTPDYDCGVTSILAPSGMLTPGSPETITLRIQNFGLNTLTSIPVVVTVTTGQPPITATWSGTLLAGDSVDYTLPSSYTPLTISNFDMCAYTDLATDLIYSNDTTCINLSTNVGIDEANALHNIQLNPNPAKDYTVLEFNTVFNGNAIISIRTPEGKLVQAKEVYISSGKNAFEIETHSLAAGVYIWRINNNDVSEEGKLIIVR